MSDMFDAIDQIIEAASSSPECFKCGEPITELNNVRIVTVRIDDKPVSVWVHAAHAAPDLAEQEEQ